jgi:hypothetical protein
MKGACDGGLHIPHSAKRFPGYKKDGEKRVMIQRYTETEFMVSMLLNG